MIVCFQCSYSSLRCTQPGLSICGKTACKSRQPAALRLSSQILQTGCLMQLRRRVKRKGTADSGTVPSTYQQLTLPIPRPTLPDRCLHCLAATSLPTAAAVLKAKCWPGDKSNPLSERPAHKQIARDCTNPAEMANMPASGGVKSSCLLAGAVTVAMTKPGCNERKGWKNCADRVGLTVFGI